MKLKSLFNIEEGVRAAVEIDSVERSVLNNVYGVDVCTSRYRIVRLLEFFNSLRASMALYKSSIRKYESGCFIVLSEDGVGWNMVKAFCKDKGFEDDDGCINHLIDILTEFLHTIAIFQQMGLARGIEH
ncbi:MAG: hypothetical protein RMI45_03290 [Ignisphaera sp.]|nr:hypothetical protein [Ignisphaera sp.]MDW8085250.1 hypothetical protein [Ignisphaera sp.]